LSAHGADHNAVLSMQRFVACSAQGPRAGHSVRPCALLRGEDASTEDRRQSKRPALRTYLTSVCTVLFGTTYASQVERIDEIGKK
jgi:hypothetical protein